MKEGEQQRNLGVEERKNVTNHIGSIMISGRKKRVFSGFRTFMRSLEFVVSKNVHMYYDCIWLLN